MMTIWTVDRSIEKQRDIRTFPEMPFILRFVNKNAVERAESVYEEGNDGYKLIRAYK